MKTSLQALKPWFRRRAETPQINNDFYDTLGDRWYEDDTHAIALLRAESRLKLKYIRACLQKHFHGRKASEVQILDLACGAGFIANPLAASGFDLLGSDISEGSLAVARRFAPEGGHIRYELGDAHHMPMPSASFDAVLMLDFLEHTTEPQRAISEAARLLRPGGLLFIQTFNKTWLSYFLGVRGISWLTKDCPDHLHVWDYFIPPETLNGWLKREGLALQELKGVRPRFSMPMVRSFFARRVHPDFDFKLTNSLRNAYLGYGIKTSD